MVSLPRKVPDVTPHHLGGLPCWGSDPMSTRSVVTEFARQFYDERDVAGAFTRFVAPDYIQHNPTIADGRDAAIAALAPTWARPELHLAVRSILVDGDTAVLLIDGQFGAAVRFGVV